MNITLSFFNSVKSKPFFFYYDDFVISEERIAKFIVRRARQIIVIKITIIL